MVDSLDLALLAELDRNCRTSFVSLGKTLKALPETLRYRFQRLEDEGVIRGCSAVIDSARLGFAQLKLLLRLHSCSEEEQNELVRYLQRQRKVMRISLYEGEYDVGIVLKVNRLETTDKFVTQLLEKFGSIISRRSVSLNVWGHYLDRTYLSKKKTRRGARAQYGDLTGEFRALRPMEREILRQLSMNARMSAAELERVLQQKSKDFWFSADAILNRIRSFERERIITGYVLGLNLASIDRFGLKVVLELQPTKGTDISELVTRCQEYPEITRVVKTLGQWDLELDFEVREHSDYRRVMMALGARFRGMIREHIALRYLSVEKFQFYSGESHSMD